MSKQSDHSISITEEAQQRLKWCIRGMHCGSCAAKVERSLKMIEGVQQVRVIFATERLLVELAPNIDASVITETVKAMGYRLESHDAVGGHDSLWQQYGTFIMLAVLTFLSTLAYIFDPSYGSIGFTITTVLGVIPLAEKPSHK